MTTDVLSLFSEPNSRKLRIFAFDPSLSAQYDMAGIGEITIPVLWEENLKPGPVGEYIQVVDADPASGVFYRPVNLDEKWILAQDGLAPSETNPLFHQQMVYAVAMTTIAHFEQALGRVALWSARRDKDNQDRFVRHLRIYPHALRDRNAYYSPDKKALLFGYFPVGIKDANNTPGTLVFTCLSHDIIAHETTHALLDGVHPRFNEPINHDVLAFHEAFADIVALFQHFSYPGILRDQIARTRGDLGGENLLGQLAQQFGKASGRGTALRDALGGPDENGVWRSHKPDVRKIERTTEPHDRGAILVAAVFGAFLKVYRARVTDLYRIASEGTGVLRAGELPPDLSNRLADEAARAAQYVLQMCIRAIDYCPPVGITFGDYLRAIVTGDYELNPDDPYGYRLAFIESFRQWGIHPRSMRSMSLEALLWPTRQAAEEEARSAGIADEELHSLFQEEQPVNIAEQTEGAPTKRSFSTRLKPWNLESDRRLTWNGAEDNAAVLWAWLMKGRGQKLLPTIGIVVYEQNIPATVFRSRTNGLPSVEVHSVRTALRRGPRGGAPVTDLVVEITQRRRGYFDPDMQEQMDNSATEPSGLGDFIYRSGCTLLINPVTMEVRRVIRTAGTIIDDEPLKRMRTFLVDGGLEPDNAFNPASDKVTSLEPFALLHRHGEGV
jgi:hypothetical protein